MDGQGLLVEPHDSTFYNTLKKVVWVIKVTFKKMGGRTPPPSYLTGFSVSTCGLILTSNQPFNTNTRVDKIFVRRVEDVGFQINAAVEYEKKAYGIVLLKAQTNEICDYARVAENGSLYAGQDLLLIGHFMELVYSYCRCHVAFPFPDDASVVLPDIDDGIRVTCNNFESNAVSVTLPHRILGHAYEKQPTVDLYYLMGHLNDYMGQLDTFVPIIQIAGLGFKELMPGYVGSPLFKGDGEVIGMLVFTAKGYGFAIHAALLRHFLQEYRKLEDQKKLKVKYTTKIADYNPGSENPKRRARSEDEVGRESSKKSKNN